MLSVRTLLRNAQSEETMVVPYCDSKHEEYHLQYKQDRGQDDVYLLLDHYISFVSANYTHNLIVLPCVLTEFMLAGFHFCCFLSPSRDRNQQSNRTSLFG